MSITRIPTDNPRAEQWKLLSRFYYSPNIERYLISNGKEYNQEVSEFVAGSMRQAEGYFTAASLASLDIAPLLIYYGSTNLLSGVVALKLGTRPEIFSHGMKMMISKPLPTAIGDYEITLADHSYGAIHNFAGVFDGLFNFHESRSWTIGEILGSVPAISPEFETIYPGKLPSSIPVRTVQDESEGIEFLYDEISMEALQKYPDPGDTIASISGIHDAYIRPRINIPSESAKLYPRRDGKDIGIYSVFGEKYLPLVHKKNEKTFCPSQLVILVMGLFGLGYLSRYHPHIWNPFVHKDQTGERLIIERFLAHCQRFLPNLALNQIENKRVQFVFEVEREVAIRA